MHQTYKRHGSGLGICLAILAVIVAGAAIPTANALVSYPPSASIQAGDITTTQILDGTILPADVSTATNNTWGFYGSTGIGTTSPTKTFSVQGNTYFAGTTFIGGAITATSTLTVGNGAAATTGDIRLLNGGILSWRNQANSGDVGMRIVNTGSFSNALDFSAGSLYPGGYLFNVGTNLGLVITGNGMAGVGTTTPAQMLGIQGSAIISGDISAANITATGTITTQNLTINGTCTNCVTSATTLASTTKFTTGTGIQAIGKNKIYITSTGTTTTTMPGGVTLIDVLICAGGGQGGGSNGATIVGNGGSAGGCAQKIVDITGTTSITSFVGAGGSGATGGNAGNSGKWTTFGVNGSFFSCQPGVGGQSSGSYGSTAGGLCTNGDININGGRGASGFTATGLSDGDGAPGGSSNFGGPDSYAAGGDGGLNGAGSAGTQGIIVITW